MQLGSGESLRWVSLHLLVSVDELFAFALVSHIIQQVLKYGVNMNSDHITSCGVSPDNTLFYTST